MSARGTGFIDAVSYSATRKLGKGGVLRRVFSILLFTVFVIIFLLALAAGTSSYGSLTKLQNANDQRVMSIGPIVSAVRANDALDAPAGEALVVTQKNPEGTYETRIYLYGGNIVQEFALAGAAYSPNKATVLVKSSTFSFDYQDGLLTISTDAGECKVALRSKQGGA